MTERQDVVGGGGTTLKPNSARATVGGVGGGTGVVAAAQAIGTDTTIGILLLYAAPTVSVLAGVILFYLEVQASQYFERRLVNNARKVLEGQLDSTLTSDEHKARIRSMLEDLEVSIASTQVERVKLLGSLTLGDGRGSADA